MDETFHPHSLTGPQYAHGAQYVCLDYFERVLKGVRNGNNCTEVENDLAAL
jgi:hypothetical protein